MCKRSCITDSTPYEAEAALLLLAPRIEQLRHRLHPRLRRLRHPKVPVAYSRLKMFPRLNINLLLTLRKYARMSSRTRFTQMLTHQPRFACARARTHGTLMHAQAADHAPPTPRMCCALAAAGVSTLASAASSSVESRSSEAKISLQSPAKQTGDPLGI